MLVSSLLLVACGYQAAHRSGTSRTSSHDRQGARSGPTSVPDGDWRTFDYDSDRGGIGPSATGITASNVGSLRARTVSLPGVADSTAIQLHGVKVGGMTRDVDVVTTTYGRTIAFDPATGKRLWEYVPKDIRHYQGSAQITTASPVAGPGGRYLYAASPDGIIHKLAVADGHQIWAVRVTYNPSREKIGSALNLHGRYVIVTTGGYFGDQPTYQGHVAVISRATGQVTRVWNSLCSDRHHLLNPPSSCPASDSAIWARSGAVVEPGSGRLLVATGNGPFNGHTNWGDSVLELTPDATGLLHNWTPKDQVALNRNDLDLGSTAPALLPGTSLAVQGGKSGKLELLDLRRLNGTSGKAGPKTGGQLQTLTTPGSGALFSAPLSFARSRKTYVVVADSSATAGYLLSHRRLRRVWEQHTVGTSPVIAGGLLFVYDQIAGRLRVMNPTSGRRLASLPAASGHWSSPIVVGGRVILPVGGSSADNAKSGRVLIYHLVGR
jgi:outer membrane protein assembly factor BamB